MGVGETATDQLRIYVRLPVKIKEELQIKDLHPDIQTIVLPRQKSRRWCFIKFQDQETLVKVAEHLKTVKIDNKPVIVKPFKQRQRKKGKSGLSTPEKKRASAAGVVEEK